MLIKIIEKSSMFLALLMGVAQIITGNMVFRSYMSLFGSITFLSIIIPFLQNANRKKRILYICSFSIGIVTLILSIIRISILEYGI